MEDIGELADELVNFVRRHGAHGPLFDQHVRTLHDRAARVSLRAEFVWILGGILAATAAPPGSACLFVSPAEDALPVAV
jgi:hypothetical protein